MITDRSRNSLYQSRTSRSPRYYYESITQTNYDPQILTARNKSSEKAKQRRSIEKLSRPKTS